MSTSSRVTTATVIFDTWNEETRRHPALAWMEKYTNSLDSGDWSIPWADWHASDFTLQKTDGTVVEGGSEAWEALKQVYGPFVSFKHEPSFSSTHELEGGWGMIGIANLFVDLPGSAQTPKVKDLTGREWDMVVPSAFLFHYAKDSAAKHDGIVLKSTKIFGDSGPIIMGMLKRGILKPEQLMA